MQIFFKVLWAINHWLPWSERNRGVPYELSVHFHLIILNVTYKNCDLVTFSVGSTSLEKYNTYSLTMKAKEMSSEQFTSYTDQGKIVWFRFVNEARHKGIAKIRFVICNLRISNLCRYVRFYEKESFRD